MSEDEKALQRLAYSPASAAEATSRPRSRIFEAMKNGELAARKDGKAVVIERDDLLRWIRGFPVRKAAQP
jgi:hypothetical protein